VFYVLDRADDGPTRFGFVVGKNVGGAVTRNLVRRRLREAGREVIRRGSAHRDIVVRALPGAAEISWATLQGEVDAAMDRSVRRT
jgi:ribonuclease P protein component